MFGHKKRETDSAVMKLSDIADNLKRVSDDLDVVIADLRKEVKIRDRRRVESTT